MTASNASAEATIASPYPAMSSHGAAASVSSSKRARLSDRVRCAVMATPHCLSVAPGYTSTTSPSPARSTVTPLSSSRASSPAQRIAVRPRRSVDTLNGQRPVRSRISRSVARYASVRRQAIPPSTPVDSRSPAACAETKLTNSSGHPKAQSMPSFVTLGAAWTICASSTPRCSSRRAAPAQLHSMMARAVPALSAARSTPAVSIPP